MPPDTGPVVGFAATTATALLAAPAIAGRLAVQFGLPPSRIGLYFAVEQAGMALATVPALYWLNRVAWRRVAMGAMAVFILANLLSAGAGDVRTLLALRALSSLSGGTLMVLSMTLAGRSAERERLFALWTLGQLVVGAGLLIVLPHAFERFGIAFLYALLAVLMAANAVWLPGLPTDIAPAVTAGRERLPGLLLLAGVAALLSYYIGFGGVWPFLAAIARSGGIASPTTGTILALAGLAGIAGAATAVARGRHNGWATLVAGYGLHGAALLALVDRPSPVRFAVAAMLFKGGSNFTLPFILARTARLDRDGRLMGVTSMAIGGGLAIGPLIAGQAIEARGGFGLLIALSLGWIAASFVLVGVIGLRPTHSSGVSDDPVHRL